jgi:hypothetical protein
LQRIYRFKQQLFAGQKVKVFENSSSRSIERSLEFSQREFLQQQKKEYLFTKIMQLAPSIVTLKILFSTFECSSLQLICDTNKYLCKIFAFSNSI